MIRFPEAKAADRNRKIQADCPMAYLWIRSVSPESTWCLMERGRRRYLPPSSDDLKHTRSSSHYRRLDRPSFSLRLVFSAVVFQNNYRYNWYEFHQICQDTPVIETKLPCLPPPILSAKSGQRRQKFETILFHYRDVSLLIPEAIVTPSDSHFQSRLIGPPWSLMAPAPGHGLAITLVGQQLICCRGFQAFFPPPFVESFHVRSSSPA